MNFLRYYQRFEKEENFGKFEAFIAEVTNTRKSMRLEELLLQDAQERGLEQGLEQGKEKTERRIVENALKKGLSIDFIAELTSLSIVRVQQIIDEIKKA